MRLVIFTSGSEFSGQPTRNVLCSLSLSLEMEKQGTERKKVYFKARGGKRAISYRDSFLSIFVFFLINELLFDINLFIYFLFNYFLLGFIL